MILIDIDKPKNCRSCRFNVDDCYCAIHNGYIDRDDYTNDDGCPIIEVDKEKVNHILS